MKSNYCQAYVTNAAANTTNVTFEIDLTQWEVDPTAARPPWWGRLAAWLDNHVAHELCWKRWVPGLGKPAFWFCQWASEYDWPVYRKVSVPTQLDNQA